jgi:hypothetical protein
LRNKNISINYNNENWSAIYYDHLLELIWKIIKSKNIYQSTIVNIAYKRRISILILLKKISKKINKKMISNLKYDFKVTKFCVKNFESNDTAWLYKINEIEKLLPNKEIYWSWVCAMRCSNNLLQLIKLFKNNNKQLFFHELLIPTIVKNNNLKYKLIDELKNIIYRNEYNDDEIINNPTYLYHPMKDLNRNHKLRLKIK